MTLRWKLITFFTFVALTSCGENQINSKDKNDKATNDSVQKPKVVYGVDDRKDVYQVNNNQLLSLADSTVALIDSDQIEELGGDFSKINGRKFGDSYNLCAEEPFREQPTGAFCSGFLVSDEIIVTAGHCIRTQNSCIDTKFVFGFAMKSSQDTPEVVNSADVYGCQELIHSEVDGSGADFAVVKLDRKVLNHEPLSLRQGGQVTPGTDLTVIGHPAGIPTKIAGGAKVRSQENGYFNTNLDTYGGNSGSAVFNSQSGEVEGILVRGATDFVYKNGCRVSNVCENNGCRGEDVTQITRVLAYLPAVEVVEPVEPNSLSLKEYENSSSLEIPDYDSHGVSSYLVADSAPLGRSVQVEVDISHSWRGDLKLTLTAPNGKEYILHDRSGSWQNDLRGTFGVELQSVDNLHLLSDVEQGLWKLTVSDHARRDVGTLNSWVLKFVP